MRSSYRFSVFAIVVLALAVASACGGSTSPTAPTQTSSSDGQPRILPPPISGGQAVFSWQYGNDFYSTTAHVMLTGVEGEVRELTSVSASKYHVFVRVSLPELAGETIKASISNNVATIGRSTPVTRTVVTGDKWSEMEISANFEAREPGTYPIRIQMEQTGQHPKTSETVLSVTVR